MTEIERLKATCDAMIRDRDQFLAQRDEAREAARKIVVALSAVSGCGKRLWFEAEYPWLEE